ncbi:MAG: hypothetical protein P1U34_09340 [Coxiellaceae bacterium]|nr:hypothetical protein [Coxiellaceae bacterium]
MPKKVSHVPPRAVVEFIGNTIIHGDIGAGASVTIRGGTLTVGGNIQDSVTIRKYDALARHACSFFGVGFGGAVIQPPSPLYVGGNVGNDVNITADNSHININGIVGERTHMTTDLGSIKYKETLPDSSSARTGVSPTEAAFGDEATASPSPS